MSPGADATPTDATPTDATPTDATPTGEAYVEQVLRVVEQVPAGRVITYGAVAAAVGVGGPRQVGRVMATVGGAVSWWRVVRADGQPARGHEREALRRLDADGTPLRGDRVDLRQARWDPEAPADRHAVRVQRGEDHEAG